MRTNEHVWTAWHSALSLVVMQCLWIQPGEFLCSLSNSVRILSLTLWLSAISQDSGQHPSSRDKIIDFLLLMFLRYKSAGCSSSQSVLPLVFSGSPGSGWGSFLKFPPFQDYKSVQESPHPASSQAAGICGFLLSASSYLLFYFHLSTHMLMVPSPTLDSLLSSSLWSWPVPASSYPDREHHSVS